MSKQVETIRFNCDTLIAGKRFVTIDPATLKVAYTGAGLKPNGYTEKDSENGVIEVFPLSGEGTFMVELAGTVSAGAEIEVGANGKAIVKAVGIHAAYAYEGGVSGGFIEAFNLVTI